MVKGDLVKLNNLIKWTLQTTKTNCDTTEESQTFEIQNRKCTFSFYYGHDMRFVQMPINLTINIMEKEENTPSVDVIILVYSSSKVFSFEKRIVSVKRDQMLWHSFDFGMLGSLLTFEMIIYNVPEILKDDKSVQTLPYIDNTVLLDNLSKDFGKLFDEGQDYDVEFICDDETIKAHKNILCSRSKVFASMLQSDMKEGKIGEVKIQDMESDILRQFLRCLYTGKLSELTVDKALLLYEAADKYAVDSLRKQCVGYLMNNTTAQNACEILVIADRHSDLDFKKNTIEYMIKTELPNIGEKWADFCKEHSFLATEVLNLFCQRLQKK